LVTTTTALIQQPAEEPAQQSPVDTSTFRIVSGVLAVACVVIIILRRKSKKKAASQDEF
jgi:hypothetical protein